MHKKLPLKCEVCQKALSSQFFLDRHLHRIHGISKEITCDLCNKTVDYFQLKRHLASVHDIHSHSRPLVDPFKCDICGKTFLQKNTLRAHQAFIHRGIKHECPECKKLYSTAAYLEQHRKSHDPTNKKTLFSCEKCPNQFTSKANWERHMRKHEGNEIMHLCDICGLKVSSVGSLRHHKRTHTGEKPFKCDTCDKRFTTKCLLQVHQVVHTNERRFVCQVCGKRFTQKHSLTVHLRSHTGEKPYACVICNKAFITKTLLKNHTCRM